MLTIVFVFDELLCVLFWFSGHRSSAFISFTYFILLCSSANLILRKRIYVFRCTLWHNRDTQIQSPKETEQRASNKDCEKRTKDRGDDRATWHCLTLQYFFLG